MKRRVLIIICLIALILAFTLLWFNRRASAPDDSDNLVVCTMDALICPDGTSAVGRSGPNCEFEDCPETPLKNESEQ